MPKKVLFLPQTSELAPAAGFRIYQYLPYLKNYDIEYDVMPAIPHTQHTSVYGDNKSIFKKFYNYLKAVIFRTSNIKKFMDYDCIFFQKETFPYMYPLAEKLIAKKHPNVVFDFDDAVFLKYKHTGFFKNMLPLFKTVIVGNQYLYEYASKYNKNTIIIPTNIDTNIYTSTNTVLEKTINIGWSGSITTNRYLNILDKPLQHLFKKHKNLRLTIISNSKKGINLNLPEDRINFVKWDYNKTADDLKTIDIGLMPLPINKWSEGKCALKLLQYMSLEIPSICSPTDANTAVITDGVNGFIASDDNEWITKTEILLSDAKRYKDIAENAKNTVVENYSVNNWIPEIIKIIKQ